jgi:hypothetical protein
MKAIHELREKIIRELHEFTRILWSGGKTIAAFSDCGAQAGAVSLLSRKFA